MGHSTGATPFRVAAAAAKSLQSCPTLRPQRWQRTRLLRPWDSPGKNTRVGFPSFPVCSPWDHHQRASAQGLLGRLTAIPFNEYLDFTAGGPFPFVPVSLVWAVLSSLEGFPCGSDGKASAYNVGDPGSIPGSWVGKFPWRRKWQPTPVFMPGKSHGRRSLVGYSPWGRKGKEPETTERLHFISLPP